MTSLLIRKLVLHFELVANLFDLTSTLVLLGEEAIDKVGHLDLKFVLKVILNARQYAAELVVVLEVGNFESAHVLFVSALLRVDQLHLLL